MSEQRIAKLEAEIAWLKKDLRKLDEWLRVTLDEKERAEASAASIAVERDEAEAAANAFARLLAAMADSNPAGIWKVFGEHPGGSRERRA